MSNESLTPDESLAVNGESFHWAKRFLGKKMGSEAAKLYAFCRLLDDMADGDIENGSLMAGQSVSMVKKIQPVVANLE